MGLIECFAESRWDLIDSHLLRELGEASSYETHFASPCGTHYSDGCSLSVRSDSGYRKSTSH